MNELNPKQKRFCEEYIVDLNATQAYIRAGYEPQAAKECASRLLTNANIHDYIANLQIKIQQRTTITVDSIVLFIKEVSEEARDKEDASNALKGADMLMKHLGAYTEKALTDESKAPQITFKLITDDV